jgi:hypothetical protein
MERVTFLVESTGAAIPCLVNPDSVVIRRLAGLRQRRTPGGLVTGTRLSDDPLTVTGGGRTEIELDLLFDISLVRTPNPPTTVQDLTRPLWELAENAAEAEYPQPRVVRVVWGKSWNIPVVVAAVSERFERFTVTGVPERSWVRLRLIRVGEPELPADATNGRPLTGPDAALRLGDVPEDQVTFHEVLGGEGESAERLDEIAARYYGEPGLWRVLAVFNQIDDPLQLEAPSVIRVPPLSAIRSPR